MIRIAVIFDNFGPYHLARLAALAALSDLTAIELRARSEEYAWDSDDKAEFRRCTLLTGGESEGQLADRLRSALSAARPQAVLVPGWSSRGALAALAWCGERGVPAIVMSDSQASDFPRWAASEWIKRSLLKHVAGALVGGAPHVAYAAALGVNQDSILTGYDVVDNDYFKRGAAEATRSEAELRRRLCLPRPYLLASSRFIAKKNLPLLLDAYANSGVAGLGVDLVLMGDGPLQAALKARIQLYGLDGHIRLPGFVQYSQLPVYYGLAQGFVHSSTTEQWGLVVNEAMASGLPVIVSKACGCVSDLVNPGVNGFTFLPTDATALAGLLREFATMPAERRAELGAAGQSIIELWTPSRFARNAQRLGEMALENKQKPYRLMNRALNAVVASVRRGT